MYESIIESSVCAKAINYFVQRFCNFSAYNNKYSSVCTVY